MCRKCCHHELASAKKGCTAVQRTTQPLAEESERRRIGIGFHRDRMPGLSCATAAVVLPIVFAAGALRLWRSDLSVRLEYHGDALFYLSVIKGVLQHGWYLHNPDLGAPFGQQFYDFPQGGDNLNYLIIRLLGVSVAMPHW